MKPGNATVQDDIPPVHVLEAAQSQDRKETEDLLAGFDRPGRSPKSASKSKERDFVDYYARKKPGSADSGGGRAAIPVNAVMESSRPPRQADVSTVIVHRNRPAVPPWLGWAAVALGMLLVGGVVAYLATSDVRPGAALPMAPSAATTITSASSPAQPQGDMNIPPPAPAEATAVTTTATTVVEPAPERPSVPAPRGSARRDGRDGRDGRFGAGLGSSAATTAAPSVPHATNATDDTKPPPRDDFIRDL